MIIKKASDGEFYLMRRSRLKTGGGRGIKKHWRLYSWFPVRAKSVPGGTISFFKNSVSVPREFVGKKLRFKVEVVEDKQ